jgi:hypothetical protein
MRANRATRAKSKLKRKIYEKELRDLQVQLCRLQDWVKHEGLRVIIVFEGRDAAGKGGTIKAITERVSPRVFRVVALPAPSSREKTQMYFQRYIPHFPAAGEVIIFDRSWYNRAGVEYVMGFCSEEEHRNFLIVCPEVEQYIVDGGIGTDQVVAGGRQGRAGATFLGSRSRSPATVEAQPDGSRIVRAMVPILESPRRNVKSDGYQVCALAHRAFGRQAPGPAQLHFAYPENSSGRQGAALKSQTAQALEQGQIRRSS